MPASRSARATPFAPRSWPSRPGLAIITLILCSSAMCGQTSPYGDYIASTERRDMGHVTGTVLPPCLVSPASCLVLVLPPLDQLDRDPVRGRAADAGHAAARPDAHLGRRDLRALVPQGAYGGVQVLHLYADREEPFAALLELLVEAPLLLHRLHQLDEGVAHRQPCRLEAGSQRLLQRRVHLQPQVAFPLRGGVLQVLRPYHHVVQLLDLQGSLTSVHWLERWVVLAEKRVEAGRELTADESGPVAPRLAVARRGDRIGDVHAALSELDERPFDIARVKGDQEHALAPLLQRPREERPLGAGPGCQQLEAGVAEPHRRVLPAIVALRPPADREAEPLRVRRERAGRIPRQDDHVVDALQHIRRSYPLLPTSYLLIDRRRQPHEHAAARFRVQEADHPRQPLPRLLVDELHALRLQPLQLRADVRRLEADVVQPFPLALQEPPHRRLRRKRLQQLDLALADGEERGPHALLPHRRRGVHRQPQRLAVEPERLVQAMHRNADVMDLLDHIPSLSRHSLISA